MIQIDLTGDYAVSIGASYKAVFKLCNAPDLTLYTGTCHIRQNITSENVILTPEINILTKDTFEMFIPFGLFTALVLPGNYVYDVLFTSEIDRFYAVGGKITLLQRVTKI